MRDAYGSTTMKYFRYTKPQGCDKGRRRALEVGPPSLNLPSTFIIRATPMGRPCFFVRKNRIIYNRNMELGSIGGLIAFVLGWFFAQSGKFIGDLVVKKRPLSFAEVVDCFTRSGGMPSGHTASFTGLTVFFGLRDGFTSGLFILALAMTIIVVYDAVNVRYAVGEQGKLLNIIAESDHNKRTRKMRVVEGHTIPQVCVGAILGILLGFICNNLF